MAFTGIATLVAGEAVTATVVLSAMAEVGTVMSVVGAVTGNKGLLQFGAALGLVGGIGGLVNGAVNSAAGAAASEAGAQAGAANALSDASYAGADWGAAAGGAADTATTGLVDAASAGATAMPVTQAVADPIAMNTAGGTASAAPATAVNPTDARLAAGTQQAPLVQGATGPVGAQAPVGAVSPADVANPTDMRLAAGTQASPLNAPVPANSFLNSIMDFASKNGKLLSTGAVLVGGAMSGANQRDIANQKIALQQQAMRTANSAGSFAPGIVNSARTAA